MCYSVEKKKKKTNLRRQVGSVSLDWSMPKRNGKAYKGKDFVVKS